MADERCKRLLKRIDKAWSARATLDNDCQDVADYMMIRSSEITSSKSRNQEDYADIYDDTAKESSFTLAAGCMSYIFPSGSRWLGYESPSAFSRDPQRKKLADDWYQKCAEEAYKAIADSNFHLKAHELMLQRNAFGTALMFCNERTPQSGDLVFRSFRWGQFVVWENEFGEIDQVACEWKLSAENAADQFGIDNLERSVREAANDPKRCDDESCYVHVVMPSKLAKVFGYEPDVPGQEFVGIYLDKSHKHEVSVGGFWEMPYFATRYLTGAGDVYGWSPGLRTLPTQRQLQFLQMTLDSIADTDANPRVLTPSNLEGEVDMTAGGETIFDENFPQAIPREWLTGANNAKTTELRIAAKQDHVRKAFHTDLFNIFSAIDNKEGQGKLTATEVQARLQQKLEQFSPTFFQLDSDLMKPLGRRVFGLLYRAGRFPQHIPEVVTGNEVRGYKLAVPDVVSNSRIAFAMRALDSRNFMEFASIVAQFAEVDPTALYKLKISEGLDTVAKSMNVPMSLLRTDKEVEAMIRADRERQAAMDTVEATEKLASATGKADPKVIQMMAG